MRFINFLLYWNRGFTADGRFVYVHTSIARLAATGRRSLLGLSSVFSRHKQCRQRRSEMLGACQSLQPAAPRRVAAWMKPDNLTR